MSAGEGIEEPRELLGRLKLGREEYCQRLLTMLILDEAYPRWNTVSAISERGRQFLRSLDELSFGKGRDLTGASFVDEFDLPRRTEDARGCAPDYAVLSAGRLWMVELKTERGSHRADQIPSYFELARHHHPATRIDLTYLTGPLEVEAPPLEDEDRYAHVTWSQVLPLIRGAWADGSDLHRRVVDELETVLANLSTPWQARRAARLQAPPPAEDRRNIEEALSLAEATAQDHEQRALDFRTADLADLYELRDQVRENLRSATQPELLHVKPWLWSAPSSGGSPLTGAGAEVGYELRLSWYAVPARPNS